MLSMLRWSQIDVNHVFSLFQPPSKQIQEMSLLHSTRCNPDTPLVQSVAFNESQIAHGCDQQVSHTFEIHGGSQLHSKQSRFF